MNRNEESDPTVLASKPTNKAGRPVAEPVERRVGTKGNANQHTTRRAQNRESVTQALDRVRQAARTRKKERFTALLHHVDVDLLRTAFLALQRDAAPGVDGLTWKEYETELEPRLANLQGQVHLLKSGRLVQRVPEQVADPLEPVADCLRVLLE